MRAGSEGRGPPRGWSLSRASDSQPQDWRFLLVLFSVSTFLELMAWGHMLAFGPLFLKEELNVPPEDIPRWAGILVSSSLLVAVPLSPLWGVLADRYSRKLVIMRAMLVESVAFGLAAVCTTVWQFLAVRTMMGFCFGSMAVVMATQSMASPRNRVGTAVGVIQTSATLATSVGPLLGSLLIRTVGLRGMFAVDAALALASALVVGILFREPDLHDRATPLGERLRLVFRQVSELPPVRWNFACWFLVFGGAAALEPFLPVLIDRLAGADSATAIGGLLAAYGLLSALGTPAAGWLADRVGPALLILVAAPLLAVVAGSMGLVASLPLLALLVMLRAVPQAGMVVALYSHVAAHVPVRHRAAVMSLTPMPKNVAWLLIPGLAGLATGFGLWAAFWFAAALYGGATITAVLLARSSLAARGATNAM